MTDINELEQTKAYVVILEGKLKAARTEKLELETRLVEMTNQEAERKEEQAKLEKKVQEMESERERIAAQLSKSQEKLGLEKHQLLVIQMEYNRVLEIFKHFKSAMILGSGAPEEKRSRAKSCGDSFVGRVDHRAPRKPHRTYSSSKTKEFAGRARLFPTSRALTVIETYTRVLAEYLSLQYSSQNIKGIFQKIAEEVKTSILRKTKNPLGISVQDYSIHNKSQISTLEDQLFRKITSNESDLQVANRRVDELSKENDRLQAELESSKQYKLRKIMSSSKKSAEDIKYFQEANNFKDVLDCPSMEKLIFNVYR
jgi:hypothetical protein